MAICGVRTMVLGDENDSLKASRLSNTDPLCGVECRGLEQVWVLIKESK
jgi:hypothetical protein